MLKSLFLNKKLKSGFCLLVIICLFVTSSDSKSEEPEKKADKTSTKPVEKTKPSAPKKTDKKQETTKNQLIRLDPKFPVWVDKKNKRVIADSVVCLRKGQLEVFACLKGTKEHEAVVAVHSKAYIIHAALLVIGAKVGTTVDFGDPRKKIPYKPATGQEIEITLQWIDKKGKTQTARGQDWVRDAATQKALKHPWVFAGSGFWEDPVTHKQHYMADGGELISVSNFPSATMDLPIKSSQSNDGLLYEAFTERIPPLGTKVRVTLTPKPLPAKAKPKEAKKKPAAPKKPAAAKNESPKKAAEKTTK